MAKKTAKKMTAAQAVPKLMAMVEGLMDRMDTVEGKKTDPPKGNGKDAPREYTTLVQGNIVADIINFIDKVTGRVSKTPVQAGEVVTLPEVWGGGEATFRTEERGGRTKWDVQVADINIPAKLVANDRGEMFVEVPMRTDEVFSHAPVLKAKPSGSYQHYTVFYGSEAKLTKK